MQFLNQSVIPFIISILDRCLQRAVVQLFIFLFVNLSAIVLTQYGLDFGLVTLAYCIPPNQNHVLLSVQEYNNIMTMLNSNFVNNLRFNSLLDQIRELETKVLQIEHQTNNLMQEMGNHRNQT